MNDRSMVKIEPGSLKLHISMYTSMSKKQYYQEKGEKERERNHVRFVCWSALEIRGVKMTQRPQWKEEKWYFSLKNKHNLKL